MLSALDPQKVCFLIVKIRALDVQATPNLGGGSDASDDKSPSTTRRRTRRSSARRKA